MALAMMALAVLVGTQVAVATEGGKAEGDGVPRSADVAAKVSDSGCRCDPDAPVRINHATAKELCSLPGIGPAKAERIMAERARRPFRKPSDLRRVKGFGSRTIQRLAPRLSFE